MKNENGLVMVFALLILLSLTVLGVASVSGSLMQNKMATSMEKKVLAFDAAEAAIAGVVFESEDEVLLSSAVLTDPLSEARQGVPIDLANESLSCSDINRVGRAVTSAGLTTNTRHVAAGSFTVNPDITSWSRTAFIREQACRGSSNVIGGSNISCHVFVVRGCGKLASSTYAVANTLTASVFAPSGQ